MKKEHELTQDEFEMMLANPFYCLSSVDITYHIEHQTMITEDEWIKVGVKIIEEIGAEKYLRKLLDNLKGKFVRG